MEARIPYIFMILTPMCCAAICLCYDLTCRRKSLVRYDAFSAAMGALLLACKIEEKSKILREVLVVFHRVYQRRCRHRLAPLELGGLEYNAWKE
jgi:hypothetical protein